MDVGSVDVEIDVVVVEDVDEELVVDVVGISVVTVDEVTAVVVGVDSVDAAKDVEDEISVVVDTVDGIIDTVRVELPIGKNLTALTAVILEITPATANKRTNVNAIRTATDFIQPSLLPQNRMSHFLPRACD